MVDTIRIKKNEFILILYSIKSSDMNFQTILMPKVILAKLLSQKNTPFDHSYLKYALDKTLRTPSFRGGCVIPLIRKMKYCINTANAKDWRCPKASESIFFPLSKSWFIRKIWFSHPSNRRYLTKRTMKTRLKVFKSLSRLFRMIVFNIDHDTSILYLLSK